MSAYLCTRCETITREPVEFPVREHYAMGDALVPHDFVELRCHCGGEIDRITCCVTCRVAVAFEGFDDCLDCGAAELLRDPTQLALIRQVRAGTAWLKELNAAIERILRQDVPCGRVA